MERFIFRIETIGLHGIAVPGMSAAETHIGGNIQQDGEIGFDITTGDGVDLIDQCPPQFPCDPLLDDRGIKEAVGNKDRSPFHCGCDQGMDHL